MSNRDRNLLAALLDPFKAAMPPNVKTPSPRKATIGRCYELAGRFVLENEEATLVHGFVMGIPHAWAELGNLVYDGTCKGFFDREAYYRIARAKEVRRLAIRELADLCGSGVWGPCPELKLLIEIGNCAG